MSKPRLDKRNLIEKAGIYDSSRTWGVLTRRVLTGVYRTEMGQPGPNGLVVGGSERIVGYQPSEVLARFYHEEIKTWAHDHAEGRVYDPPGVVSESRADGQLTTELPDGSQIITRRGEVVGFQQVLSRDGHETVLDASADHLSALRRHDRKVMMTLMENFGLYQPTRPSWLPDRTPPEPVDTSNDWLL